MATRRALKLPLAHWGRVSPMRWVWQSLKNIGAIRKEGHDIVDHFTYCFLGDGCMMEGIPEVCSGGTLKLGKLVAFWDDNGISIDGEVEGWFSDDTPKRFESYGWHVIPAVDGHDPEAIAAAIEAAKAESDKPTLICTKTVIGFGSPNKQGTHGCHGAPLGDDEIAATRKALGWDSGPFEVPADVYQVGMERTKVAAGPGTKNWLP